MGSPALHPTLNKFGAGTIYMAPLLTAVPTLVAAAGKFTQTWTGWTAIGGTNGGITLTRNPATADFNVAESFYPQHILQTGDDIQGAFTMDEISKANFAYAMNAADAATVAGTGGNYAVTGASGAKITQYNMPLIGKSVNCMLGWQSQDDDEVLFLYEVTNVASVALNANKGPQAQELLMQLRSVLPATNPDTNLGQTSANAMPFRWYFAGTLFD